MATRKAKGTIQAPQTREMMVLMPLEPSDEVAQMLSSYGAGFNMGERIDDGRRAYARLRDAIARQQIVNRHKRSTISVSA